MKQVIFIFPLLFLFACNQGSNRTDRELALANTCEEIIVDDFSSFITIKPTTAEAELKKILGKSTGGKYSDDRATFIYAYEGTKRVPIKVYVNAKSGIIETVFMEILGLKKNFDIDVKKAKSDYPINECHASLYGKQPKETIELFGQAAEDNFKEDNVEAYVRVLRYYTKDKKIAVTFNFYPSQEYRLSSIVVDWL